MSNQKPAVRQPRAPASAPRGDLAVRAGAASGRAMVTTDKRRGPKLQPWAPAPTKTGTELARQQEDVRATLWECVPVLVKKIALRVANLPVERAIDPLVMFSPLEQKMIKSAVVALTSHIEIVTKIMGEDAFH